ncbi:MAG: tripartite tricarboxylate transporter family receptor [Hyphomicrobiales bacterium]|nr:tripartite tricarboxylate transporter family receptor [Hyphomicrobiales bacterium]
MRATLRGLPALVATLFFSLATQAQSQSIEQFYRGKTITVMIGYGVGGSDDLWARLISRHMGRFIPGQPNVVPQNVPGAGSLVAANQIYNTAPKDGTVFGLINRGVPFEPLFGGNSTQFDPRKYNYIGSPDRDTIVCFARADTPFDTVAGLRNREMIVAATGSGADSQTYPVLLRDLLGLKVKIVAGYPGSREMNLAVERNEAQATFISYDTAAREPGLANGTRRILFQGAVTPDPRMKDVPTLKGLAADDAQSRALDFFLLRGQMGRPFVAPPGVPAERIQALQAAFDATLKDPQVMEEAKKQGLNISYISPPELAAVVDRAYLADPETIARVRKSLH